MFDITKLLKEIVTHPNDIFKMLKELSHIPNSKSVRMFDITKALKENNCHTFQTQVSEYST